MTTRQIHAFAQLIDQLPIGVQESEVIDGAVADNSVQFGFTAFPDAPHEQHSSGGFGSSPSHHALSCNDTAPSLRGGESVAGFAGYAVSAWNGKDRACCSGGPLSGSTVVMHAPHPDAGGTLQPTYTHSPCMDFATGVHRGGDRVVSGSRTEEGRGDSLCDPRIPLFDGNGPGNRSVFRSDLPSSVSVESSSTQADVAYYMPAHQHRPQQTLRSDEYCSSTSHSSSPVGGGSSSISSTHPVYHSRNVGDRDHYHLAAHTPANASPFANPRGEMGPCSGAGCGDCSGAPTAHSFSHRDGVLSGISSGNGDASDPNGVFGWPGSRRSSHTSWGTSSTCCPPSAGVTGHMHDGSSLMSAHQAGQGGLTTRGAGPAGGTLHCQPYSMCRPASGQVSHVQAAQSHDGRCQLRGAPCSSIHVRDRNTGGNELHASLPSSTRQPCCYSPHCGTAESALSSAQPGCHSSRNGKSGQTGRGCPCDSVQGFNSIHNYGSDSVTRHRCATSEDSQYNGAPSGLPPSLSGIPVARGGSTEGSHQRLADPGRTQRVQMNSSPLSAVSEREEGQRDTVYGKGMEFEGAVVNPGCSADAGSTTWAGGGVRLPSQGMTSGFGQTLPCSPNQGASLPNTHGNATVGLSEPAAGGVVESGTIGQKQEARQSTAQHGSTHECSASNVDASVSSSSASTFEDAGGNSSCGTSRSQNGSADSRSERSARHRHEAATGRVLSHRRVSGASVGSVVRGEASPLPDEFSKNGQALPSAAPRNDPDSLYDKLGYLGDGVGETECNAGRNSVGCGGSGLGGGKRVKSDPRVELRVAAVLVNTRDEPVQTADQDDRLRVRFVGVFRRCTLASRPCHFMRLGISSQSVDGCNATSANGARPFPLESVKEHGPEEVVVNFVDAVTGAEKSLCVDHQALLRLARDRETLGERQDVEMSTTNSDFRGRAELPNHEEHSLSHISVNADPSRSEADRDGGCGESGKSGDSRALSTDTGSGDSAKESQNHPAGMEKNVVSIQGGTPQHEGKEREAETVGNHQGSEQTKDSDGTDVAGKEQGRSEEMTKTETHELGDEEQRRLSAVIRTMEEELNRVTEELREVLCQREDGRDFYQKSFLDRKLRYLSRLQEIRPLLGASFTEIFRAVTACRTVGQLSTWVVAFEFTGASVASAADVASRVLEVFNSGAAAPLHMTVDRFRSTPQFRPGPSGLLDWDTGGHFGAGMRLRTALLASPSGSPCNRDSCFRGGVSSAVGCRHAHTPDSLLGFRCTSPNLCPEPAGFALRAPSLHAESHLLPFTSVPGDETACGGSSVSDSPLAVQAERSAGEVIRSAMRTRMHETSDLASRLLASGDARSRHLAQSPRARLCSLGDSVGEEEDGLHRCHPSLSANSPIDVFSGPGELVDSIHKGLSPRTSSIDDPVSGRVGGSSSTLYVPFIDFECGPTTSPTSASRLGTVSDQVFWPSGTSATSAVGVKSAGGGDDTRNEVGSLEDSRGGAGTGLDRTARPQTGELEKETKKQGGDASEIAGKCLQGAAEKGPEVDDATASGSRLFEKESGTVGPSIELDVYPNQRNQNHADASVSPSASVEEVPSDWRAGDGSSISGKSGPHLEGNRDSGCVGPSGETESVTGVGDAADGMNSVSMCFVPFPQLNCSGQGGRLLSPTASLSGAESIIFGCPAGQLDWGQGSYRLQKLIASEQLR
ncbi:UNVERIFIED_CONTAM: hypothetical protein HHA_230170 [Hammondia hammondi]|eukprot:XP_008889581.1 hypothetical protein HHA_230170 [Hammondia hammondi]